jgi:hypothetical protein
VQTITIDGDKCTYENAGLKTAIATGIVIGDNEEHDSMDAEGNANKIKADWVGEALVFVYIQSNGDKYKYTRTILEDGRLEELCQFICKAGKDGAEPFPWGKRFFTKQE